VFTLRSERLDGSLDMRPIVSDSAVFLISVVLGCATTRNAPLPAISYFHEPKLYRRCRWVARAWSGLPSFLSSSMCPSSWWLRVGFQVGGGEEGVGTRWWLRVKGGGARVTAAPGVEVRVEDRRRVVGRRGDERAVSEGRKRSVVRRSPMSLREWEDSRQGHGRKKLDTGSPWSHRKRRRPRGRTVPLSHDRSCDRGVLHEKRTRFSPLYIPCIGMLMGKKLKRIISECWTTIHKFF
jgi:hypothetical protein